MAIKSSDWSSFIHIPVSSKTLGTYRAELVDEGLIEKEKGRPTKWRVTDKLQKVVANLGMELVEGYVLEVDKLSDFNQTFTYEKPEQSQPILPTSKTTCPTSQPNLPTIPEHSQPNRPTRPEQSRPKLPTSDKISRPKLPTRPEQTRPKLPTKNSVYNKELTIESGTTEAVTNSSTEVSPNPNSEVIPEKSTKPIPDSLVLPDKKSTFAPGEKNRFYDWEHYGKFTPDDWEAAKANLTWPGKESGPTMLIGAYLIAMKQKRNIREGIAAHQFGLLLRESKRMLEYFSDYHNDEIIGFNKALDWIRFFVTLEPDSFEGTAGWPIRMCLKPTMYTKFASGRYQVKTGKKRNNTGEIITTPEQRERAMENSEVIDVSKYLQ